MSKSAIQQSQNLRANIVLIALGLFFAMIFVAPRLLPYLPSRASNVVVPTVHPAPSAFDACVMAQVFIKRQLKSPSTADFPACNGPDTVISGAGNFWQVSSYVDAQNSFGAMLRADYSTDMRYSPSTDKWSLIDFTLDNR